MSCYPTLDQVRRRGVLRPEDIERIEASYPGITLERAAEVSAFIDAQLIKRYLAPFQQPYPDIVIRWASILTSYELLVDIRGADPDSPQLTTARERYDRAHEQIQQAANAKDGLFELPARQDTTLGATAVNAGGPFFVSDPSPYTWVDRQAKRIWSEGW